jgi:hypothetical protein
MTPEDFDLRKPNLITQMAEATPAVFIKRDPSGDPRKYVLMGAPCKPREVPGGPPDRNCVIAIGSNSTPGARIYRCVMTVYLDRVRIVGRAGASADDFVNEMVVPSSVAAMEIYPRGVGAPSEFQPMNGSCGVVLIWTK